MSLKTRLQDDIKQAMRAADKVRLKTLRMAAAAIKQKEVDERIELDDSAVLAVIEKMIKQRRESTEQFRAGKREDLAAAEEAEIELLTGYLPEPLDAVELEALINSAIAETGAESARDMGRVMAALKDRAQGRADMREVAEKVKARLAGA